MLVHCAGNGTEDIVRRYAHPSRLFFFSLHLYDKDEPSHAAGDGNNTSAAASTAPPTLVRTTTDRPIDAATSGAGGSTPTKRSYEFYPGTGLRDDHVSRLPLCCIRAVLTLYCPLSLSRLRSTI